MNWDFLKYNICKCFIAFSKSLKKEKKSKNTKFRKHIDSSRNKTT